MDFSYNNSRRKFLKKTVLASSVVLGIPSIISASLIPIFKENKKEIDNMVFLFQGDSITDGNRGRNLDPNHIMGHGYAFSIASRLGADFPEKNLTFYNRGISGHKITDIAQRWQTDTIDLKPNVLSILVGVNDCNSVIDKIDPVPVEKYEDVFYTLLSQAQKHFPEILIVICEPFILPVGRVKDNWEEWHSDIIKRQEVAKRLAKKFDAVFVELQSVFNNACKKAPADYWIWDGIHPTVAGHELITREWLYQVSKKLDI